MAYFGEDCDLKALLEMLKSDDDPVTVHQHILMLQSQLSRSEEKTLAEFPLNGFITRLIELLGHTVVMDFQIDTKFSILQSFYFLMDIFPNTIGQMVTEGLISKISTVIQENMAYTELAEQAAKLFIKISTETPDEVLSSPAIQTLMQVYDFCDQHTQQKVLQLCLNVSRNASSEDQFNSQVMPILQWIYPKLQLSQHSGDQKVSEKVATIILNIITSMQNFYSPSKDFAKNASMFEKIINIGMIETVTECIREYSTVVCLAKVCGKVDVEGDHPMDGGLISTGAPSKETTYTEMTISLLVGVLLLGCRYSHPMIATLLSGGILEVFASLLPTEGEDQPTFAADLVSLINQMLPQTEAERKSKKLIVFGGRNVYPPSEDPESGYMVIKTAINSLETQKLELYSGMNAQFFEFCASQLLQKLFYLYRENIAHQFREKCISLIDKTLAVLPNEVVHDRIDPVSLAQLSLQILATGTGQQVLICLEIVSRVLSSNTVKFAIPFQREGTSQAIIDMAQSIKLEDRYDKEEIVPSQATEQPLYGAGSGAHRFSQIAKGLFGGSMTDDQTIDIIQLEVDKIKSILQMTEANLPTAKRDMLAFALKEKELQVKLLQETVAMKKEEEAVKKVEQEKKKDAEEEKKDESAAAEGNLDNKTVATAPPRLSQLITTASQTVVTDFLKNEQFLQQVREVAGGDEELNILATFKVLAGEILDEACSSTFDCEKTQALMEKLTAYLTDKKSITSFEFRQSGILQALEIFFTKAPSLALVEREQIRNKDKNEEMKHSEELILSAAQKQSKQQISKKEARCLILRLKVAAHCLCLEKIGKFPMKELIHQCHDIISNNESILFSETKESKQHQDASEAIRQLNRRDMIKLVYDPDGSHMEKDKLKAQGLIPPTDEELSNPLKVKEPVDFGDPILLHKGKSCMLPFSHMGVANDPDQPMEEEKSQVYYKRDRLFTVLGKVAVDVQHAENLWMVEERIKKIDTLQKAKDYSQHLDRHPLRGLLKPSEEADEIADRFAQVGNAEMQDLLDRISNRLDEMLDEANSQEQFEQLKPGFTTEYTEEVCEMALETDVSKPNLQLFFDMVHLEMEEKIQEHELGVAENEDANLELLRPEHIKQLMLVKIKAFGGMIKQTREKTIELFERRKREESGDNQPPAEEEKKAPLATVKEIVMSKVDEQAQHAKTKVQFVEPPQIQVQLSADPEEQPSDSPKAEAAAKKGDIEMTDEQVSSPPQESILSDSAAEDSSQKKAKVAMAVKPGEDKNMLDGLDLNDLIKKNSGQDVDVEFYFDGKLMPQNTCFYEIFQLAKKGQKKLARNEPPKFDKSNPSAIFKHLMATMHRGEPAEQMSHTIYFRLVDRNQNQSQRRDSLIDYISRKDRTKSQAADLVSVQALNHVVQRLINDEFSVFRPAESKTAQTDEPEYVGDAEKRQLEQALKILKVMQFITRNTHLLSASGLNFLLSRSSDDQELASLATKDMNLGQVLSGKDNLFYHQKLDANILKSIQDPHKLVSGGLSGLLKSIFTSCSFLFHYETKLLYCKLVSFLGVDINRSLAYLRNYQKKKATGQQIIIPNQHEERKGGQNTNELMQKEEVGRDSILEESIAIMERLEKRKQLDIKFRDEPGTGLGPTYEFFTKLARAVRDAETKDDQKLWRISDKDGSIFPSPVDTKKLTDAQVTEMTNLFRLAGTFVAKSIVDNKLIDLPISSLMWDLLLGKNLNLFDLRDFDTNQFKLLRDLQQVANRKREISEMNCDQEAKNRLNEAFKMALGTKFEDLYLFFTLPGYEQVELVHDGTNTQLTLENVQEYIDLVLHSIFYDCVNLQLQAFKKGFNSVLPLDSIRTFSTREEIEMMICGEAQDDAEWKDMGKLQQAIKPDHGFTSQSRCYHDFLRYIAEMEPEFRPKFISWLTGCKRLPKGGFGSLEHQVSINKVSDHTLSCAPDEKCPSVNTCLHYVKFPEYSSYEVLKWKFEQAILLGADNFALT